MASFCRPLVLAVSIAASLASASAFAQSLYRSVGADGRVTYSDQAPAGANGAPARPASQTPAASVPLDPALERAVTAVLMMEELVRQTETLCLKARPTAMSRYLAAYDGWRKRNGPMVRMAGRGLDDAFDPATRQAVREGIRIRQERQLAPVAAAGLAQRMSWCDQSADETAAGKLDVHDKPALSGPLAQARR